MTCNASGSALHELNFQLQGLQSRLKTIERTISTHQTLTILGLIKTIAAFIAGGLATSAAVLSADPSITIAIQGAGSWEELMDAIPGLDFTKILAKISMANITLTPFDDDLVSGVIASIEAALADAEASLAAAISGGSSAEVIASLQATVDCLNISITASGGFKTAQNRLASGQISSSILGS